jgi:putative transport protein
MSWLLDLARTYPSAQAIAIIALACMAGMALGSVKVRGIGLGTAGVLFAGILLGSISEPIDHKTLEFVKEFGLILFVYCIGMQLGPGFFASLRQFGFRLNALAALLAVLGVLTAPTVGWLLGIDSAAVLGLFSGGTTNTPSLGAAQQTLKSLPGISEERAALPALAYSVSYPMAIVGIIATMLGFKIALRIDPRREAQVLAAEQAASLEPIMRRTLVIENPEVEGLAIAAVPGLEETCVVLSRLRRRGDAQVEIATGKTVLRQGDHILAVGTDANLDQCQHLLGQASSENLLTAPGPVTYRRVVVTNSKLLGKSVQELGLEHLYGVVVTRVTRADLEMTAVPNLRLQFGDVLQVVGTPECIQQAADILGNSLKALNETHFVPLFAGMVAGIALGTLPLVIPGLPQPLRLGLAGGPLIVAILVSRVGRIGPLVWHMPLNANLAFREFGIALFFASVGLLAGPQFFATVFSTRGLLWLAGGTCVTVLPILAVGIPALFTCRMNYVVFVGLLSGSMTNPSALTFANNLCDSESPMIAYATVYPLTMLMRILAAQVLAVALCG